MLRLFYFVFYIYANMLIVKRLSGKLNDFTHKNNYPPLNFNIN